LEKSSNSVTLIAYAQYSNNRHLQFETRQRRPACPISTDSNVLFVVALDMELRDYLTMYWRQRWLIVTMVVVATLTTYLVASTRPVQSGVSTSFAVNRVNREITPDYQFDGYYALQAADLFAQTVVSWFSTPAILQEIYQEANLDPASKSIDTLPSRFHVKKYSAQNIVVRFTERTPQRAEQVAVAMNTVLTERTEQLNQTADNKSLFALVATKPVVADAKPNPWLFSAAAAVVGLGLALLTAAGRQYLRA